MRTRTDDVEGPGAARRTGPRRSLALLGALLVLLGVAWAAARAPRDEGRGADARGPRTADAPPPALPGLEGRADAHGDPSGASPEAGLLDDVDSSPWRRTTTVRVVSSADGSPVEGVLVRVTRWESDPAAKPEFREGRTASDGCVSLATAYPAEWLFRKRGYWTVRTDGTAMQDASADRPILLTPAPPLSGRVVLAGSRTGVSGARVVAWLADEWHRGGLDEPQTTDADGAFELAGVPPDRSLRVAAAAEGLASAIVTLAAGEGHGPLEITLGGGAVLGGTIRDTKGAAVPDAEVLVAERGGDDPLGAPEWDLRREVRGEEVGLLRVHARSGPDGRFGLRGLATPAAYVLVARTASGATGRAGPVTLRDPGAQAEQDVTVAATGTITVRTAPPLGPPEGLRRGDLWRDAERGVDGVPNHLRGRFRAADGAGWFEDVPAGIHRVFLDFPEFVAAAQTVEVRPGEDAQVRFDLDPGVELSGRLVDEEGRPIGDGYVYFRTVRDSVWYVRGCWAGRDGGFTIGSLPRIPGTLGVSSAEGYLQAERTGILPGTGTPETITLRRGGTVVWRWPSEFPGADEIGYVTTEGPPRSFRGTEGLHSATRLEGLPPQVPLLLYAKVRGFPPILRSIPPIASGATLDLGELAFPEPRTLRGTVCDARHVAVAGARVRSVDPWSAADARTDGRGAFRLTLLPPGATTFVVAVDGVDRAHGTVDLRETEQATEFVLPDPGRIEVTVRDRRGEETAGLPFNLVPFASDGTPDERRRVIVRTDSVGRVEATLEPGRYRLEPHSQTRRSWSTPAPDLVVESGKTLSLDLTLD